MSFRIWLSLALIAPLVAPANATACSNLTKEGARKQRETHERYLRERTDKIIRGTWRAYPPENSEEEYATRGHIEVTKRGKTVRYRFSMRNEINCGFPNYSVDNEAYGFFYLKKDEDPDPEDDDDGFVDNFGYVHFRPLNQE